MGEENRVFNAVIRVTESTQLNFKNYCKQNGLVIGHLADKILREYLEGQVKPSPGKKGGK